MSKRNSVISAIPFSPLESKHEEDKEKFLGLSRTASKQQAGLGINFDPPGKWESPVVRSSSFDLDNHTQTYARNSHDIYRHGNSSANSLGYPAGNNNNGNSNNNSNSLTATMSNLTFSPMSSYRPSNQDMFNVLSPKEKTKTFRKSKLLGPKKSKKKDHDASDNFDTYSINNSISDFNFDDRGNDNVIDKKKILSEISSLTKPSFIMQSGDVSSSPLKRVSSEYKRIKNDLSDAASIAASNSGLAGSSFVGGGGSGVGGRSKKSGDHHHHHHHHQHHHHHHLLSRNKKDISQLSSSNSNSKIIYDNLTFYNFRPNADSLSGNEMLRKVYGIENEMRNGIMTEERKKSYVDSLLHALCTSVLPLFKGESLITPIEDLNKLIEVYLKLRINVEEVRKEAMDSNNEISTCSDAKIIIDEFKDFFELGFSLMKNQNNQDNVNKRNTKLNRFNNNVHNSIHTNYDASFSSSSSISSEVSSIAETELNVENRVAGLWDFFMNDILSYLEAILLPLQLEFEGNGIVLTDPGIASKFWSQLLLNEDDLSTKRYILIWFRDSVVVQSIDKLGNVNKFFSKDRYLGSLTTAEDIEKLNQELLPEKLCLMQCFGILSTIQSDDYHQNMMESLLDVTKRSIHEV